MTEKITRRDFFPTLAKKLIYSQHIRERYSIRIEVKINSSKCIEHVYFVIWKVLKQFIISVETKIESKFVNFVAFTPTFNLIGESSKLTINKGAVLY